MTSTATVGDVWSTERTTRRPFSSVSRWTSSLSGGVAADEGGDGDGEGGGAAAAGDAARARSKTGASGRMGARRLARRRASEPPQSFFIDATNGANGTSS